MEVGRQILGKLQRRKKSLMTPAVILPGLEVHFYLADTQQIIHLKGRHSAEQLCTEAAKKLGEFLRSAQYRNTPLDRSLVHFNRFSSHEPDR